MNFIRPILLALLALSGGWAAAASATSNTTPRELITCGREKVLILDLNTRDAAGTPKTIWSWRAADRPELPAAYRNSFRSTDECKAVDGGRRILITASGAAGAVALVERSSGEVVFYGSVHNGHSADLLPRGRIAAAASRDPKGLVGDALILFDIAQPGRELWRTELTSGHGVVWDEARQVVWALSDRELRSYRLLNWASATPRLERAATITLPESGGHDLYPIPGTSLLSLTTSKHCWIVDRDTRKIQPHPTLADRVDIKSITTHPLTGQIAFTAAEAPNWWTTRIQFLNPVESVTVPGEEFYKVRWNSTAR
jgi:hypothetical protein